MIRLWHFLSGHFREPLSQLGQLLNFWPTDCTSVSTFTFHTNKWQWKPEELHTSQHLLWKGDTNFHGQQWNVNQSSIHWEYLIFPLTDESTLSDEVKPQHKQSSCSNAFMVRDVIVCFFFNHAVCLSYNMAGNLLDFTVAKQCVVMVMRTCVSNNNFCVMFTATEIKKTDAVSWSFLFYYYTTLITSQIKSSISDVKR